MGGVEPARCASSVETLKHLCMSPRSSRGCQFRVKWWSGRNTTPARAPGHNSELTSSREAGKHWSLRGSALQDVPPTPAFSCTVGLRGITCDSFYKAGALGRKQLGAQWRGSCHGRSDPPSPGLGLLMRFSTGCVPVPRPQGGLTFVCMMTLLCPSW